MEIFMQNLFQNMGMNSIVALTCFYAAFQVSLLSKSVIELNKNMAVVVEKLGIHNERIRDLEKK